MVGEGDRVAAVVAPSVLPAAAAAPVASGSGQAVSRTTSACSSSTGRPLIGGERVAVAAASAD